MNKHSSLRTSGSLLERAAELYGFEVPTARAPAAAPEAAPVPQPRPEPEVLAAPMPAPKAPADFMEEGRPLTRARPGGCASVERERLREGGFIDPDAPAGALAEEFRIVKRQLLLALKPGKGQTVLVCSAQPDEGKTFCAINLALSLAAERDTDVLLVDGDFSKPEILSLLGVEGGAGLVDALADPKLDPESLVIRTDIGGLSVLPAGRHVNNVTELLGAERTREVLTRLTEGSPKRIVIFDSPPALMASPATVLAAHAGQLLMVVRADETSEADLKEALGLLSACDNVSLLLNGAAFAANGRRFGSYYGYGQ
jgi:exopolysaccharide/PEP-CTERM locus tyrosine autokinase